MIVWGIIGVGLTAVIGLAGWLTRRAIRKANDHALAHADPQRRARLQKMADDGTKIS